jgi:hypothetical protein
MIEVRTYDGDMQQLTEFCNTMWARRYTGKMPFAVWTPEFLAWELDDSPQTRELNVAAYDGARLVGVLPAKPMRFHVQGQTIDGSWGSYFSVDPDYESQPVSLKLNLEQRRRHKERGLKVNMGYVFTGYAVARGQEFWLKQDKFIKPVRRMGMWVRLLDPAAVGRFSMSKIEVLGTHLSRLVLGPPRPPRRPAAIRPFAPGDAAACTALLDAAGRRADLGYAWDETLAARQLGYTAATRTLVAEHEGRVAGLINYCPLRLLGRTEITAGVIDFLETQGLPLRTAIDLVRAALQDMRSRGMHMAMALRISSMPFWPLARTAFTMMPSEYWYVAQPINFELPNWRLRKLNVHWR